MAKISSITYPDIVGQFAGLLGGVETRFGVEENAQIRIGAPRDLDLSGVDPTVNISEATAKTYDLFHLTDNVVIRIYAWYHDWQATQQDPVIHNVLQLRSYIVNTVTGNKTLTSDAHESGASHMVQGFLSGSQQGMSGAGRYFCCPKTLVDTYKLKLVLVTEYYTAGLNPDGFGIILLMPTTNSVFPATLQSWSHISRGYLGKSNNKYYFDAVPSGNVYYPFNGAAAEILWVDNLQFFENFVKGYDPTFKVEDILDVGEVDEPIQDLDPSEPGGGEGDYDEGSDPIDFPALPTGGALASGGCKAYLVTSTNLRAIFNKLWSTTSFDISTFQKLYDCPMDSIISLHALPITPHNITSNDIYIGNFNTEVRDRVVSNQYLTVDCGSIDVKEFWGSALDYNPYTKAELFLPFVGIKEVDIDDVMDKTVHIKYNIDVLTGDCIANVKCGASVLYKYAGNMKQNIPVSGKTSNLDLNGIQGVFSTIAGAAMGTAVGGPVGTAIGVGAGLSAAAGVVGSKVTTQRASGLTGNVGILDDYVPYIILHRPIQSLANKFKSYKGYPSNITAKLSTVSGYTEVEYVNLQGIPNATSEEMDEIKSLLQSGVII